MSRPGPWPLLCGVVVIAMVATEGFVTWRGSVAGNQAEPPAAESTVDTPVAPVPETSTTPPTSTPLPAKPVAAAGALVQAAERAVQPDMTVGVAVLNLRTGDLAEGVNGSRQFYSASLSKLILVVDMLDRRRLEGLIIPEPDLALVNRALTASDDSAMNVLWGRYSGPAAIGRVASRAGLTATAAPRDPSQWGEVLVTAADLARTYRYIHTTLPPAEQGVIVNALAATQPTARDGFHQHYGLLSQGASTETYAKQGWMSYRPRQLYLHSAGVTRDYAIVLLSIQNSALGSRTAQDRLSTMAKAATDILVAA